MQTLNKVLLIGNLGKDPEVKTSTKGDKYVTFSVATSESYKQGDQKVERTEWHAIVAWRQLAEYVEKVLKKGTLVYIEGKINTREWTDNEGKKRFSTNIEAHEIKMLVQRGDRNTANNEANNHDTASVNDEEDLPF